MKIRTLVTLAFVVAALPLAVAAKGWEPPRTLKVKWPAAFQNKGMALQRIAEAESYICAKGQSGKMHYIWAAMGTPKGSNAKTAAEWGTKNGKYEIIEADEKESRIKRGGAISWISFSIRSMRTTTIFKAGKPKSEVFYELEIPPTSIPTSGDWTSLCNEAKLMLEAAKK